MLIYDVFWLFGADIISFTAGALSYAPTTIVWPRNINTYIFERLLKSNQYFTSVGLGDIIVPGRKKRFNFPFMILIVSV